MDSEVKQPQGFTHPMFQNNGESVGEKETSSLDFGQALIQLQGQWDSSITLWGPSWGPGVQTSETPSSILSQSLQAWRKDNAQLPAAKAAEELDKMYENLPPEALDLTFQDMIGRSNSPKGKEENGLQQKKKSLTDVINEEVEEDVEEVKNASGREKKGNGLKLSIPAKIATLLSPRVCSPSTKGQLSHADLDKLLEKRRRRKSKSSEGLYSASSTPASSFRRLSPFMSPRSSPSVSFNMLQIDRQSLEREIAKSARYFEAYLDDTGGMAPVNEESSRQSSVLPIEPHNACDTSSVPYGNECSSCSTASLFFLKTTCLVCGKSFCPSCRNTQTKEVRGVRRCNNNCQVAVPSGQEKLQDKRAKGKKNSTCCWPIDLGSFMRAKRVNNA